MTSHAMGEYSPQDPPGCVDCEGFVPAEYEVVTGIYMIAGEPYETVELMCLQHKYEYEMAASRP